ncbi:hypothetical protein GCM10007036_09190 [Alsobacter metallidurans]|uniref:Glycosyl transferase family 28 C-terminal domain-containing protein n=1 Tax=Alsobacter metallidurans TaxID=340221 RepID=A0A917MGZ3_9HYPH|nr:glycosyltransferase [Alsobacter metallidurans]GGH11851.1 hypothetical protein GCM10007036_09190 [Alsobacter metallidurans]
MSISALFVVTHLLGTGHLARTAALARAMARRGHRVTLVSGGRPAPMVRLDGVDLVQLPPAHCVGTDFATLLGADDAPLTAEALAQRRALTLAAFERTRPDLLVTELFPFGRRQLAAEFVPLLQSARGRDPRPAVVCSVRDILQSPSRAVRAQETLERLCAFYDRVLVHGDPEVVPLDASWPVGDELERRLAYTGYVGDPPPEAPPTGEPAPAQAGAIVVSGGGGAAGLPLLSAGVAAGRVDPLWRPWRILAGHGVAERDFEALRAHGCDRVVVERARPDFVQLLREAAVSVSQAGYNTVMDIAAAGARAVLVPFEQGGEREQRLRAEALAERGLVVTLQEANLTPEALLRAVHEVSAGPRPHWPDWRDGAERACAILESAAAAATQRALAWRELDDGLSALRAAGRSMAVWWRDDDCVAPSPALDHMLALAERVGCPVALAVIPEAVRPELAERLRTAPFASVLQHGWAHRNHAPEGAKKQELGHAPGNLVLAELQFGRDRLEEMFGARALPVLVPPWNRIDPALVPALPGLGFRGLSTFRARRAREAAPGLRQVNTHLDPIDWHGDRGLADEAALIGIVAAHARAMAAGGADLDEAFGLLTHHLVHDGWIWSFVEELLARLGASGAVRFVSAEEAFALPHG